MTTPEFSIVVPNYNGAARLGRCLDAAWTAGLASGRPFELIVADDASTDDSCAMVAKKYSQVQLLRAGRNRGFGETANAGVRAARGTWVLILNNDAYLDADYFTHLFAHLARSTRPAFALMGSIHDLDGKLIDAAKYPEVLPGGLLRGLRSTLNVESGTRVIPTLFASGANAFVRREDFLRVGAFDPLFSPFYLEDVDLGISAWRHGLRSEYVPAARCMHEVSGTIGQQKSRRVRAVSKRNRWIFHIKHLPLDALLVWTVIHTLEVLFGLLLRPRLYVEILRTLLPRLRGAWDSRSGFPVTTRQVIRQLRAEFSGIDPKRFF